MAAATVIKRDEDLLLGATIIKRDDFPQDFLFGAGCAAYQVEGAAKEGGRGISVWDDFALSQPWRIEDGSDGNIAADMYHRYKEDIKMMKQMGLNSFRFSISWPRILPAGRVSGGVNREGIDFYNGIINTLIENEMTPFVTIFHWDLPACLEEEYGGFLDEKIRQDYLEFANICFWEFGDRVKHWTTFNEPQVYAIQGYVNGQFPPGRVLPPLPTATPNNFVAPKAGNISTLDTRSATTYYPLSINPRIRNISTFATATTTTTNMLPPPPIAEPSDVYKVARNLLLAHAETVQLYRTKYKDAQKGKIGIVLVTSSFLPVNENSEADKKACKRARDFFFGWFLEPLMKGKYPKTMISGNLKSFSKEEKEMLVGSLDFLGMNYYCYQHIEDDPNPTGEGYLADGKCKYADLDVSSIKTEEETTDVQRNKSYPKGIYEILTYLNEKYPNLKEIYITENGYHTKTDSKKTMKMDCEDKDRIKYHQDHIAYVHEAMKIPELKEKVKGYLVWAWCDTYEWNSGYTIRFGLNYVDFANNCVRYPKNSAAWFARFLHNEPDCFKPLLIPNTTETKTLAKKRWISEDDGGNKASKKSRILK